MLNISGIKEGVVLDHIQAGKSMEIYKYLGLGKMDCTVAIIKNAPSGLMGRKDIIKIDSMTDIDLTVIGYVDPGATINVIKDGRLFEKRKLTMPEKIVNVLRCKNPRCITSVEPDLPQIFRLTSPETHTYRCIYCETKAEANN